MYEANQKKGTTISSKHMENGASHVGIGQTTNNLGFNRIFGGDWNYLIQMIKLEKITGGLCILLHC